MVDDGRCLLSGLGWRSQAIATAQLVRSEWWAPLWFNQGHWAWRMLALMFTYDVSPHNNKGSPKTFPICGFDGCSPIKHSLIVLGCGFDRSFQLEQLALGPCGSAFSTGVRIANRPRSMLRGGWRESCWDCLKNWSTSDPKRLAPSIQFFLGPNSIYGPWTSTAQSTSCVSFAFWVVVAI